MSHVTPPLTRVRRRRALISLLDLSAFASSPLAQAGATRPIRLIVPSHLAGRPTSRHAWVGDELSKALGQTIVADNRPGAGGKHRH